MADGLHVWTEEFVKINVGGEVVREGDFFQKLEYGDVVVSGTGGWFASNYFSYNTLTGETREEYFECLEQASAFAARSIELQIIHKHVFWKVIRPRPETFKGKFQ